MTRFRSRSAAAIATAGLLLLHGFSEKAHHAQSTPGPYALTDLGTLGGLSAQAQHINDAGQVVGSAASGTSGGRAFVWQNGTMTDLGTLGGNTAGASAINNLGQVAGSSALSPSLSHAVLWDNGVKTDLAPGTTEHSVANGINDFGQIIATRNWSVPFLWHNGVTTVLPHLGGGGGNGADINNAGQAVGSSSTTHVTELGPMSHAVLWENGTAFDLGVLPGDEDSGAAAINELGVIVGSSGRTDPETYEQTYRPFIYQNGVMTPIQMTSSEAFAGDINDDGVIVGTMRAGGGVSHWHAFIHVNGVTTNLNSLIPPGSGLHLAYANGINNDGQIVGMAYDAQFRQHAYLLTPMAPGTPVLSISDASIAEGNAGTRNVSLTITLSPAANQTVTVAYNTVNGTASSGADYAAASGTLTFAAGQTSKTISVVVNGDRAGELDESVLVNLSNASSGSIIGDGQGKITIVDDEPRISMSAVSKMEGNSGTTPFNFVVSLSAAYDATVTVNFATQAQQATAPEDFEAKSGTLTFAPGQTSKIVTINIKGDRTREFGELFYVGLSGANGAVVTSGGSGLIQNDDR